MSRKYKFGDKGDLYFVTYTVVGWIDVFDDHGSLVGTGQIKRGGSKVEIETTQSVRLFVQVRVSSGILRYKLTVTALDGESSCLGDLEVR